MELHGDLKLGVPKGEESDVREDGIEVDKVTKIYRIIITLKGLIINIRPGERVRGLILSVNG